MKYVFTLISLLFTGTLSAQEYDTIRLFHEVTFYDGYQAEVVDKEVKDGILRHSNSLYAVKMTPRQLDAFGDSVCMEVNIRACCDNYDRIGNINLVFVPKGLDAYAPDSVQRIELGRFITPFMDKNKQPDTVPYLYNTDYLSYIFHDRNLRKKYDFWIEFSLFGVPYAAQKEIKGCEGRIDTFYGTLAFVTSRPSRALTTSNVLVPIVTKKLGNYGSNLNNYQENATDTIGKTVKTYPFYVPKGVKDAQIVLVTSNHGANRDGEEYNRRWHYVYVDGQLVTSYIPGRPTCEPYRRYNTQRNGIYGRMPQPNYAWQSFSNWCPGDAIDNRILPLGSFKAGKHTLTISVPEAQFAEKQGDIPVSAFFQGLTRGKLPARKEEQKEPELQTGITFDGTIISRIESEQSIYFIELCDAEGKQMFYSVKPMPIDLTHFDKGVYLLNIYLFDGVVDTHKIEKK